jgi:hypothetical protein
MRRTGFFACLMMRAAAATLDPEGSGMSTGSGLRSGDDKVPAYVCLMCRFMKAFVMPPKNPLNSMFMSSFFTEL